MTDQIEAAIEKALPQMRPHMSKPYHQVLRELAAEVQRATVVQIQTEIAEWKTAHPGHLMTDAHVLALPSLQEGGGNS